MQQVGRRQATSHGLSTHPGDVVCRWPGHAALRTGRNAADNRLFVVQRFAHFAYRRSGAACRLRNGRDSGLAGHLFRNWRAMLLTIPKPVMGAFLLLATGMLFVEGLRTVTRGGHGRSDSPHCRTRLCNGRRLRSERRVRRHRGSAMESAARQRNHRRRRATAIGLTVFLNLTRPNGVNGWRRDWTYSDLPRIDAFLHAVASINEVG